MVPQQDGTEYFRGCAGGRSGVLVGIGEISRSRELPRRRISHYQPAGTWYFGYCLDTFVFAILGNSTLDHY